MFMVVPNKFQPEYGSHIVFLEKEKTEVICMQYFSVDDAANKGMTEHIVNFVKVWNPSYKDHIVINCKYN